MNDEQYTEKELEDLIKQREKAINETIRKLGAEKIIKQLLKHSDINAIVKDFVEIRKEVLATYKKDKEPEFLEDLIDKSTNRIIRLEKNLKSLYKDIHLKQEKLGEITSQTTLDNEKGDNYETLDN